MEQREIKFRFWDKALKKMVQRHLQPYDFDHKEITVMQWTGIKDVNGVDVYEGDLLIDRYPLDADDPGELNGKSYLPVVWDEEKLRWSADSSFAKDGSYLVSLIEYFGEHVEILGNVFENPELTQTSF